MNTMQSPHAAARALRRLAAAFAGLALSTTVAAAPSAYTLDPEHTYPSFAADHMGLSSWRGKFNHTTGSVTLDREAGTGTVDVTIDLASIDFGHDKLNRWATGEQFFDVANYPEAAFTGRLVDFTAGAPTRAVGTLSLHGVTQPLVLRIDRFKCIPDPMLGRPRCGADARTTFQRDAFGLDAGKEYDFDMAVELRIQIEALENP